MRRRGGAVLSFALVAISCTVQVNREPPQSAPMVAQPANPAPPPPSAAVTPTPVAAGPAYRFVQGPGWAFAVPANWQQIPIGAPAIVSLRDTTTVGGFLTNVNLVAEPFAGDGPAYAVANVPLLQTAATIVAQRPAVVGLFASTELESVWTQAIPPYRTVQRFVATNGRGWVITCSGAHATFESVRPTCTAILDSFRLQ